MEDWSQDFWKSWEQMTSEVEQFCEEMAELFEELAEEFQRTVIVEVDQCIQEIFEPWEEEIEPFPRYERSNLYERHLERFELETSLFQKVEPNSANHPACVGCRHYHGQIHGGNLLVCGMHPYGSNDEYCLDWESEEDDGSR